jgi:hypothetical protein
VTGLSVAGQTVTLFLSVVLIQIIRTTKPTSSSFEKVGFFYTGCVWYKKFGYEGVQDG